MFSISLWHISGVIWSHSSATLFHNPWTPFGGVGYSLNLFFKCTHKCSIRLRSGDWAGHGITSILLSSNHLVAFFEICLGSLSYWKIFSSSATSNFSKLSTTRSSKISQYCTASIFPSTSVSFPAPFQPMHPHTMRLFPPPCLTVGVVVLSESDVPFSFQVYTLPSDPILLIFVSSDYICNPFPVLHCPVFMLLSKHKMVLSTSVFEQWSFLLDNREKVPFLGCISHCLGSDRRGKDVIDKMSSLNSIIKLSSGDLTDNWLCITRGKLGRTTTFVIFLV